MESFHDLDWEDGTGKKVFQILLYLPAVGSVACGWSCLTAHVSLNPLSSFSMIASSQKEPTSVVMLRSFDQTWQRARKPAVSALTCIGSTWISFRQSSPVQAWLGWPARILRRPGCSSRMVAGPSGCCLGLGFPAAHRESVGPVGSVSKGGR